MGRRKSSFLLLACHSDEEITDYLQKMAERGWRLVSVRGNHFRFERKEYDGRRICSYSFLAKSHDTPAEIQLRKELPLLRKQGWDMIAISGPENIFDTRRHAFLYEEHPAESLPVSEKEEAARAGRKGRRKMISNLVISVLYLLFLLILFSVDIIRITSSGPYLAASFLFSVLLLICLFLSVRTVVSAVFSHKSHEAYIRKGEYRYLDHSTALIFAALLLFVAFLLCDSLYGNTGGGGERIETEDGNIVIYSDDIPISLSDLGLPAAGEIRTSIHRESRSPLASYSYSYEQYLGKGADGNSFISYTLYGSGIPFLRERAARQLFRSEPSYSAILSEAAGMDVYASGSSTEILACDGDSVLYVRSGHPLDGDMMKKLSLAVGP